MNNYFYVAKRIVGFCVLHFCAMVCLAQSTISQNAGDVNLPTSNQICFTENKGQIHNQNYQPRPDVLFVAAAGDLAFQLKKTGVSYQLNHVDSYKEVVNPRTNELSKEADQRTIYRIDLNWLNANTNLVTTTDQELEGFNNYYLEGCPDGALNVKSYTGVTVHNLYDGINLHYYEKEGQLKHDYIIAPGADYRQIHVKVDGASVSINEDGSLILTTPFGKVQEGAPLVFQNGKQLKANWVIKKQTLSFEIENVNPNEEFIIDPVTRLWGTYYGGFFAERGDACAIDLSGNVYLTGNAVSNQILSIATEGAHQTEISSGPDAFLVKFSSDGVRIWGTYYGGNGSERGYSCSTDSAGNVFMTGETSSTNSAAIATAGAQQTTYGGGSGYRDAFLVKFDSNGVRQWGTYYGGNHYDIGWSCATDVTGSVYMAGQSSSTGIFLSTPGSHQVGVNGGERDGFLAKFDANGVREWATYYGGNGSDIAYACATDASGNVYLAGTAEWSFNNSIGTSGVHQELWAGNEDGFLAKFNSSGVREWGTYYGGSGTDVGLSCVIDSGGDIYLAGYTQSGSGTAIATAGSHQSSYGGDLAVDDAFLVKFDANGVRQWGTYYGGTGSERALSCATDVSGNVYMAGWTNSDIGTVIATTGAHQTTYGGTGDDYDAFLVKFNSNGIRQSGTYYGSEYNDTGNSCATDASGNVYLAGRTNSEAAISTPGAHLTVNNSDDHDAYLVKFSDECSDLFAEYAYQTSCNSYTWPLSGITYNTSGTYILNGTTEDGCPLTTTLNLVINEPTSSIDTQSSCDPFTWIDGNTYISSNNTATVILTNAVGCDSIVTLNLNITQPSSGIDTHSSCESFTWIDGNTYTESNNSATYLLTNAAGCDSVITLNLNITQIDATTTLSGETIIAAEDGASYQWINCNNNSPISGQTNQSFTPTVSGSYAVVITEGECTETSDCTSINVVGIYETDAALISVYPNPTTGQLTLNIGKENSVYSIKLINAMGQTILQTSAGSQREINLEIEGASGIYLIEIEMSSNNMTRIRVIKN